MKTVRLYLVRHAEAVDKTVDPDRPLSAKGRRDAKSLAARLRPLKLGAAEVWHSKKARSIQTAQAVLPAIAGKTKLIETADLLPNANVKRIVSKLLKLRRDVMLVGHEPQLGALATYLLTGKLADSRVVLSKPSVVCFEREVDQKKWSLSWMLSGVLLD